jgi:Fe2+ or Zn2+ uptake regulation protein
MEANAQSDAKAEAQPSTMHVERLRQVDLPATERRLLILDVIAAMPGGEVSAVAVLREIYARGIYIPLPSIYRILRELKRRGVVPTSGM